MENERGRCFISLLSIKRSLNFMNLRHHFRSLGQKQKSVISDGTLVGVGKRVLISFGVEEIVRSW